MSKRTLTVTSPCGATLTRTTANDYAFCVVVPAGTEKVFFRNEPTGRTIRKRGRMVPEFRIVESRRKVLTEAGQVGWTSRRDLAQKTADRWRKHFPGLVIVPVND